MTPFADSARALREALPATARAALDVVLEEARSRRLVPYAVGGAVRDVLLGLPPKETDVVVEGDAIALARDAAATLGARVRIHSPFGTATILGDDFALDLVTARRETYPKPGSLPVVEPASLRDDLLRRDFGVNALAMALDGPAAGEIVDPAGGRDDLAARRIRVLHERSFIDDPTRMLRAVRYAARLDFAIEPRTRALIERDRLAIATVTGARLRREIERMLDEPAPAVALSLAGELGLVDAIAPGYALPSRLADAFAAIGSDVPRDERAPAAWGVLGAGDDEETIARLAFRLAATRRQRDALVGSATLVRRDDLATAPPSALAAALETHPVGATWGAALAAPAPALRAALRRYLDSDRYVVPEVAPRDLVALGVPEGAEVGRIARSLRAAKLDGLVSDRDDELAFVRRELRTPPGDRPR